MVFALRVLAVGYLLCVVLALMLIPASRLGLVGLPSDALSAVWAILLAMTWSIALQFLSPMPVWLSWSVLAPSVAVNGGLLLWAAVALQRRHSRRHAQSHGLADILRTPQESASRDQRSCLQMR